MNVKSPLCTAFCTSFKCFHIHVVKEESFSVLGVNRSLTRVYIPYEHDFITHLEAKHHDITNKSCNMEA